jgi:hypothetical protein
MVSDAVNIVNVAKAVNVGICAIGTDCAKRLRRLALASRTYDIHDIHEFTPFTEA